MVTANGICDQNNRCSVNGTGSAHRRLRSTIALDFDPDACLALRFSHIECNACKESCPAGAIRLDRSSFELDASCLGCGRCAQACPTEALVATDFAVREITRDVTYDCWKTPREESPAGALRVPCLAGIKLSDVLEHLAQGKSVSMVDRGWCGACASMQGLESAASATCMAVNALLAQLELADPPVARVVRLPLPREIMRTRRTDALNERKIGRRAFFLGLTREVADSVSLARGRAESGEARARSAAVAGKIVPHERLRCLAALHRIAARAGSAMPGAFFPSVHIGPQCCGHSVCTAVCPTGALSHHTHKDVAGIAFEPRLCIGCRACARACPENALTFSPSDEEPSVEGRLLVHWRTRPCARCHDDFTAVADATLCDRCRKTEQLARSGFVLLARRGQASSAAVTH